MFYSEKIFTANSSWKCWGERDGQKAGTRKGCRPFVCCRGKGSTEELLLWNYCLAGTMLRTTQGVVVVRGVDVAE